jgi:uncharacterized protein YndB with AHSA1/START domain
VTRSSVVHDTIVIERAYPAPPERVFAAFAQPALKARWFASEPAWVEVAHELDFRVGGREHKRGGPAGGPVQRFEARYLDIVPDHRILFAYDMHLDERRISVSLATVELVPDGPGTALTFTEQGAFLDGLDEPATRAGGWASFLDVLGEALRA